MKTVKVIVVVTLLAWHSIVTPFVLLMAAGLSEITTSNSRTEILLQAILAYASLLYVPVQLYLAFRFHKKKQFGRLKILVLWPIPVGVAYVLYVLALGETI